MRPEPTTFPQIRAAFGHGAFFVLFAIAYAVGAYVSLSATPGDGRVALFWIPTGIAVGLVYLRGLRFLPAVPLAVIAANLYYGIPLSLAVGFAACNGIGVGLAAYPLRKEKGFEPGLKRFKDVSIFVGGAALGSGVGGLLASLLLKAFYARDGFIVTAFHWALADGLSIVAFAPFYLTNFSGAWKKRQWPLPRVIESIVLTGLVALLGVSVFLLPVEELGPFSRVGALLPVLLWAGLRFNPRVLSAYLKLLAVAAIAGALLGRGAFAAGSLATSLVEVQAYISLFCVSSLLVVSVSYERATLARERETHLRNVANAIPELVWTCDPAGKITFLNEQATTYFSAGHVPDHAAWGAILHPADAELAEAAWREGLARGLSFSHEHRFRRAGGTPEWFLSKAAPLRDESGKLVQWFGASMSVDTQRRTILELEEEKDIRDRMVFTLSHDIRNPLAVIDAGAQVLLKAPAPPELTRNFLEQISFNVKRANRMIVDLLDANRLRAGDIIALKFKDVEMVSLLRETIASLNTIHGNVFRYEGPSELWGIWAPEEITRIVENLCSNAVKYGDPGRGVAISLAKEEAADRALIGVHNHGSLIEARDRARIFKLFHRAKDSRADDRRGWGIGLTLVQGFTAAHGGSVEVISSEGEGTTFVVSLPMRADQLA